MWSLTFLFLCNSGSFSLSREIATQGDILRSHGLRDVQHKEDWASLGQLAKHCSRSKLVDPRLQSQRKGEHGARTGACAGYLETRIEAGHKLGDVGCVLLLQWK
jgi:hypothetical protein